MTGRRAGTRVALATASKDIRNKAAHTVRAAEEDVDSARSRPKDTRSLVWLWAESWLGEH